MKMKLVKHPDDWFTIVRAEHDGIVWYEQVDENSRRYMSSERLSPEACIDGNASEMVRVAFTIKQRRTVSFKRIAVHFGDDGMHISSPENSDHDVVVSLEDADDLAEQIFKELIPTVKVLSKWSGDKNGM